MWRLFRRTKFNEVEEYYFSGNKYELFALIGIIHSTFTVGTERIDYCKVDFIPYGAEVITVDVNKRFITVCTKKEGKQWQTVKYLENG